jgi:hypothetical protein
MIVIFAVAFFAVLAFAGYKLEKARVALVDTFLPELQEDLRSRFAFPLYVLRPSTPLDIQADYVLSLIAGCLMILLLLLFVFFVGNMQACWLFLVVLLVGVASTVKAVMTYLKNRALKRTERDSI